MPTNQTPEQLARDQIDQQFIRAGWCVQVKKAIDFSAGRGIAVLEYQTDVGPADYVLFVDKHAVGVIEAEPGEWGHRIPAETLREPVPRRGPAAVGGQ